MNILNWFGKRGFDVVSKEDWETTKLGRLIMPESISNANAYTLANSVPELFFPVDFYADRISKLRFFIAKENGKEQPNSEFNRLISNEINPFFSFGDLVYNYNFSLLSDGNAYNYLQIPRSLGNKIDPNNITRWDVLQPNRVEIDEHSKRSLLAERSMSDLVKKATYTENCSYFPLNPQQLIIHNVGIKRRDNRLVLSESLLLKANKSIDILLAVYSARYNVYANNGAAGYLSRKVSGAGNNSFEAAVMDGNSKRDEIIADINARHGLTGARNLWGISGIPIEFVKTIASISELMPLEETLENAIKIASIFQIPPVLVPRKDQSTYDNQENAERNVWENGLLSMAETFCSNITKLFGLSAYKMKVGFDSSNVSALTQNHSTKEDLIAKRLANINSLLALRDSNSDDPAINSIIENQLKEYGTI